MQPRDWKSSLLEAATYQQESAVLAVVFRSGSVYHYFGVPAATYQELLVAESKGSYFNSHIRNRFSYARTAPVGACGSSTHYVRHSRSCDRLERRRGGASPGQNCQYRDERREKYYYQQRRRL